MYDTKLKKLLEQKQIIRNVEIMEVAEHIGQIILEVDQETVVSVEEPASLKIIATSKHISEEYIC